MSLSAVVDVVMWLCCCRCCQWSGDVVDVVPSLNVVVYVVNGRVLL